MQLAPPERRGEYFGLYGLTAKLSVVGTFTFGIVHSIGGLTAALLTQVVPALLGLVILFMVRMSTSVPPSAVAHFDVE